MFSLGELVGIAKDGYDIAPVVPQMICMGMAQYNAVKAGLRIIITPEKALVVTMTQEQNTFSFRRVMQPMIEVSSADVFSYYDSIVRTFIKRRQKCRRTVFGVYYKHNQSIIAIIAV